MFLYVNKHVGSTVTPTSLIAIGGRADWKISDRHTTAFQWQFMEHARTVVPFLISAGKMDSAKHELWLHY